MTHYGERPIYEPCNYCQGMIMESEDTTCMWFGKTFHFCSKEHRDNFWEDHDAGVAAGTGN